jgi:hypothetical protein
MAGGHAASAVVVLACIGAIIVGGPAVAAATARLSRRR